jgi:hypothetical protein
MEQNVDYDKLYPITKDCDPAGFLGQSVLQNLNYYKCLEYFRDLAFTWECKLFTFTNSLDFLLMTHQTESKYLKNNEMSSKITDVMGSINWLTPKNLKMRIERTLPLPSNEIIEKTKKIIKLTFEDKYDDVINFMDNAIMDRTMQNHYFGNNYKIKFPQIGQIPMLVGAMQFFYKRRMENRSDKIVWKFLEKLGEKSGCDGLGELLGGDLPPEIYPAMFEYIYF